MSPFNVDPVWTHVSLRVPLYTPLYDPDQVPDRTTAGGGWAAVGVAAGVGVGTGVLVGVLTGALVGVGVPVVDDELHAASSEPRPIAVNITMVCFISEVLPLVQLNSSYCYTWLILPELRCIAASRLLPCTRPLACPGRGTRLEDPLEGDGRPFGDAAHRGLGTLEAAEDHLVFAHEQRAQVANDVAVSRELSGAGIDAVVERDQVGLVDTRPEALGEVFGPVWMLHSVKLSRGAVR